MSTLRAIFDICIISVPAASLGAWGGIRLSYRIVMGKW